MSDIALTDAWGFLPENPLDRGAKSTHSSLPISTPPISKGGDVMLTDFVTAVVVNAQNEMLVLETAAPKDQWSNWRMVTGELDKNSDPIAAIKSQLQAMTGYTTNAWTYLGSYQADGKQSDGRVGHFWLAKVLSPASVPALHANLQIRWIPIREVRYALIDGRIGTFTQAISVALALLALNGR